jgi:glycosyltransferase involved in cell wall biosynthesis
VTDLRRIAYVGPAPRAFGAVAGVAGQVLTGLVELGHEVDCYVARLEGPVPERLASNPNFTMVDGRSQFRYDKWYSGTELTKLATSQATRALTEFRLARELLRRHVASPYDFIYQFSHLEIFGLRDKRLPPLIVHPETHAADELRWLLDEDRIARYCEPPHRRYAARATLFARRAIQRRHVEVPTGFICPSRAFQRALCRDYDVNLERTRVVHNPIDLHTFQPRHVSNDRGMQRPMRVLFIGRISVRKGVELIVDLSHRLDDLSGSLVMELVGGHTQWSDYRRLLGNLNPRIASYRGVVPASDVPEIIARTDLLIQPSKYEPFGLTVGEALASGVPVVASDVVGAVEDVSPECARRVPVGDVAALETGVRAFMQRIESGDKPRLTACARSEAERLFDPVAVSRSIARALEELA